MSKNKNPHPTGDAAEQGKSGKSGETISDIHSTSGGANCQAGGRIWRLLPEGEALAILANDLMKLAGFKDSRSMRAEIDRERKVCVILADDNGYYRPTPGHAGALELEKFIRRMDRRAASNRRSTHTARVALKELERKPLDGQIDFFEGGAGT